MRAGFFVALWRSGLAEHDDMEGIVWSWQSIDGAMVKAPLAQRRSRSKSGLTGEKGTKRHLLVDGRGVPLSLVATGANRHDVTHLESVFERHHYRSSFDVQQHLCADKAYGCQPALEAILSNGYPWRKTGERDPKEKERSRLKARRWVVK